MPLFPADLGQVEVALDAAQGLVADDPLVAQLDQGAPLGLEQLAAEALVGVDVGAVAVGPVG